MQEAIAIHKKINENNADIISYKNGIDLWQKDTWDVRKFDIYHFQYVKSGSHYLIRFDGIKSEAFKKLLKTYTRRRLLARSGFTWGTAIGYVNSLKRFLNIIYELHPEWDSLNDLSRADVLAYIETLSKAESKDINRYLAYNINILSSFISYTEILELEGAPKSPIYKLIYKDDYPSKKSFKGSIEDKYVPENMLMQIFRYADCLPSETKLVMLIMYSTGLRISDTLELTYDCLEIINEQYWIKTNIIKTKLEDHKIPITNDLGKMIEKWIQNMKKRVPESKNPDNYLFYSERKSNGEPITQKKISNDFNNLAINRAILDDKGKLFRIKNHAFRHTYAINTLNNGMDVITLQDILGHASPEMTMAYAKLLDTTKREIFEKVVESGVFSFDDNNTLNEIDTSGIPKEKLDQFWTSYKLNAIDTPYGVCMQRSSGKCQYAKHPPCLTCRGGAPCKDLCIGVSPTDIQKYKILMSSAKGMIDIGINNSRDELVEDNTELYERYSLIYESLVNGNIIYGRSNRILGENDNGK